MTIVSIGVKEGGVGEVQTPQTKQKEKMKVEMQRVFNYEGAEVRTMMIDEEVWFVAKDITDILGHSNSREAVKRHVDEEDKGVTKHDTLGGMQNLTSVNESGMYALIFGSKLDGARKFKRWVTSEVLPTIRKHGAYMTDDTLEKSIQDPDYMIGILTALKEEQNKRLEAENKIEELTGPATRWDNYINRDGLINATDLGKGILGARSAIQFNSLLRVLGIQYKNKGDSHWRLYAEYSTEGYMEYIPVTKGSFEGFTGLWTAKGIEFVIDKLEDEGLLDENGKLIHTEADKTIAEEK